MQIHLLERGAEFAQVVLFKKESADNDTINLKFLITVVKSKKAKKPEEQLILTGLIERAVIKKYARDITISLHNATAIELMKVANGLTVFAEDVMYETNNKYTQKIYEICQFKDIGVCTLTIVKFRELYF